MCVICTKSYKLDTINYAYVCKDLEAIPDSLTRVTCLIIDNNKHIKTIPSLPSIVRLELINCAVTELPIGLINLKELILNKVNVKTIPKTYISLIQITIRNTLITQLPSEFVNVKSLSYKYSSYPIIIPDTYIELDELNLSESGVTYLSPNCKKLYQLICDHSQITSIPDTYTELRYLVCNDTKIRTIPNTLTKLVNLYCYNTLIEKLPYLPNMRILFIKNTFIEEIPKLETLQSLSISHTGIKRLDLTEFKHLTHCYTCDCVIVKGHSANVESRCEAHIFYVIQIQHAYRRYRFRKNLKLRHILKLMPNVLLGIITHY